MRSFQFVTRGLEITDAFADRIIDHAGSLMVGMVVDGALRGDAEPGGIDVGAQEQELPGVLMDIADVVDRAAHRDG